MVSGNPLWQKSATTVILKHRASDIDAHIRSSYMESVIVYSSVKAQSWSYWDGCQTQGDTQGAFHCSFFGWMMVTPIPNQTAERFVWKYSYTECLQLFTSMKILKWLQLINMLFLNLWSDIMILMDHMVSVYLYCTELSTYQLWLYSGDTQQVWVVEDLSGTSGG